MDHSGIGAIPLGGLSIGASWRVPKRGSCDDLEEFVA